VVLSDALWRVDSAPSATLSDARFASTGHRTPSLVSCGRSFAIRRAQHEAWVPLVVPPRELARQENDNYRVVARLAAGATLEQARRDASALAARLAKTYPINEGAGMAVDAMLDDVVRDVRPALTLLLGAVACLVIIACVNLANLFGARARARAGEFAVRLALGASRSRLIAQAVAEATPVLALGGAIGVVAAAWAIRVFVATAPRVCRASRTCR
jgi:predicted lysophospholipase L1 biosynthesis ABC-type transport system permease subunit